ncbi:hypothetical protein C8Q70DRAFT_1010339, partial [Cubamyces menziesii]
MCRARAAQVSRTLRVCACLLGACRPSCSGLPRRPIVSLGKCRRGVRPGGNLKLTRLTILKLPSQKPCSSQRLDPLAWGGAHRTILPTISI